MLQQLLKFDDLMCNTY